MFGPGLIATVGTLRRSCTRMMCDIHLLPPGDHHRKQRKMLNPVFSASHMRNLTPIFYEVTNKVRAIGLQGRAFATINRSLN